jgi:hypothetical protein
MFATCYLYGGLGNQLFQLFSTISYSMKHNIQFKIIYTENLGNRPVYWGSFLSGLSEYLSTDIEIEELHKIKETDKLQLDAPRIKSVILDGYFQSPRFFEEHYNNISVLCGIDQKQKDLIAQYHRTHKHNFCISMHFRRGDYKELQHIHPIMPLEYYEQALAYITAVLPNDTFNVIYFCEEEDAETIRTTEIVALKITFPNCSFRRFTGSSDWEEMLYMSCCDSHIIANSSFSWWGAYMDRRDPVVCYPGIWFGGKDHFPQKMFPSRWTKISW